MGNRRLDIQKAFERLKDDEIWAQFQRVALHLLTIHYPNLKPLPLHKDGGRDAVASALVQRRIDDRTYTFMCSLNGTLAKLRGDCRTCKLNGHETDVVVFATWPKVTGAQQRTWEEEIEREFGWTLMVYDEDALLGLATRQEAVYIVWEELGVPLPPRSRPKSSSPPAPGSVLSVEVVDALVRGRVRDGVRLREAWKPGEAVQVLREVLAQCDNVLSDSDKAAICINLAGSYLDLGDLDEAGRFLQVAKRLAPGDIRVHTSLGIHAMARSDYATARRILRSAFRRVKPDARARSAYANVLWALREDDKALRQANKAIREDPNVAQAHLVRGLVLRTRSDFDGALAEFDAAAALDHRNYFVRGVRLETLACLMTRGRPGADLDQLDRECASWLHEIARISVPTLKSLDPAEAALQSAWGLVLILRGRYEEAAQAIRSALRYRQDPAIRQNLGMVYLAQGRGEDADVEFRAAIQLDATDPIPFHNVAMQDLLRFQDQGHEDTGLLEEARSYCAIVTEHLPDDPETHMLQGIVILAESRCNMDDMGIGRARRLFRSIVEDTDSPYELAVKAHENLQYAEALEQAISDHRRREWLKSRYV